MDKEELVNSIKIEFENLERLAKEMKDLLAKIGGEPNYIEIRASSSILHDFYTGIEKIFERIALSVDKKFPKGDKWHIDLLTQMSKP